MSRGLEPVGDALDAALAPAGAAPAVLTSIVRRWPAAVGEQVAREAWPVRLSGDGTLLVHCRSSVWASELRHLEQQLRSALEAAGVMPVPALRFAVGVVPRRADPAPPRISDAPLDEERERLVRGWAAGLRDGRLRAAVVRAARISLRARDAPARARAPVRGDGNPDC